MKTIPEGLKKKQENQKQKTSKLVQKAIDDLKAEGFQISIKSIVERTGLSRSVFNKPHIMETLKNNGIGVFSKPLNIEDRTKTDGKDSFNWEKEYYKISAKFERIQQNNNDKDITILKLRNELVEKKDECEILRGKLHVIMQKCRIKGLKIEE